MLPEPLDVLLAYKAISLTALLSDTEKRVAAAIIASFNCKTGQCDPSHDRIAHLLKIDRRSVIRAWPNIQKAGFICKRRHGGNFHRNSYEPVWPRFREIEAEWTTSVKTKHWGNQNGSLSPSTSRESHLGGDKCVTQTPLNNTFKKRVSNRNLIERSTLTGNRSVDRTGQDEKECVRDRQPPTLLCLSHEQIRHADAARAAAERRWNMALTSRFAERPDLYAIIIAAVGPELQLSATEIELNRRGHGILHILDQLRTTGVGDIHWKRADMPASDLSQAGQTSTQDVEHPVFRRTT